MQLALKKYSRKDICKEVHYSLSVKENHKLMFQDDTLKYKEEN